MVVALARLEGFELDDVVAFAVAALAEYEERLSSRALRPLPEFEIEDTGEPPWASVDGVTRNRGWVDASSSPLPSRFGARIAGNRVFLSQAFSDVFEGLVRREVVSLFVPSKFLTDLTYDFINWDCFYSLPPSPARDTWGAMTLGAAKVYTSEHVFGLVELNLFHAFGQEAFQVRFREFVSKLVSFDDIVPVQRALDIVMLVCDAFATKFEVLDYTPADITFARFFFDYLLRERKHPGLDRLSAAGGPFTDAELKVLIDRFDSLPFSPSCFYNPSAIGAELCYILLEVPPTISSHVVRQLTFLPYFSIGIAQLLGCPQATFLGQYLMSPRNLAEFRKHLRLLKKNGILLDFHVFRIKMGTEIINFNNNFAVGLKSKARAPVILESTENYLEGAFTTLPLAKDWKRSWVVQQMLSLFMLRSNSHGSLTNLDHARNFSAFRGILVRTASQFIPLKHSDIVLALPLLEEYRSVLYVCHLLDIAIILAKHAEYLNLGEEAEINEALKGSAGGWREIWEHFIAKDWFLRARKEFVAQEREGSFSVALGATRDALEIFAPYTNPAGEDSFAFLAKMQEQIWGVVKGDIERIPHGPRKMREYFEELYDNILQANLVQPRASSSIAPKNDVDEFVFIANHCQPYSRVCALLRQFVAPDAAVCQGHQCVDESGAEYVIAVIKTTLDKYRHIRRKLVGSSGVLGSAAGIIAARRVVYWDDVRRNFTQNFDILAGDYAPIAGYLIALRQEVLAQRIPRRKNIIIPFSRTVLADAFSSLIDHQVARPKQVLKLTPTLAGRLKAAFLGGEDLFQPMEKRQLGVRRVVDLNWPQYGLDRYLLQVFLSAKNPSFIFENLITPATRRVLISTAVLGFQTAFIEYLWPRDSPDDRFLRYVSSRTERNVLSYSLHKVKSETRFFNLDRIHWIDPSANIDTLDLQVMLLAQAPGLQRLCTRELPYEGDVTYLPGSSVFQDTMDACNAKAVPNSLAPNGRPLFNFDPRAAGLEEKMAVVTRGDFDAMPLCLALPAGQYFRTEEIYYSTSEKLVDQEGHVILFDFPRANITHLNNFLDGIIRGRGAQSLNPFSGLEEQNLTLVGGVRLSSINPLQANPFDEKNQRYFHLPKRRLEDGSWHTLSLAEQVQELRACWEGGALSDVVETGAFK